MSSQAATVPAVDIDGLVREMVNRGPREATRPDSMPERDFEGIQRVMIYLVEVLNPGNPREAPWGPGVQQVGHASLVELFKAGKYDKAMNSLLVLAHGVIN